MKKVTLGTVPFLNSKPLIYPLEQNLIEHNIQVSYFIPSELSGKLKSREVDIALMPVAELFKNPELKIFPGISISSMGPVDSVVLLSKKSLDEIGSVALDKRSRSSSALIKIILEKFYNICPQYYYRDIDEGFLADIDSGMLIGNAGLHAKFYPQQGFTVYDLGQLWTEHTGLPFVYAVFAYHKDNQEKIDSVGKSILESKTSGQKYIEEIIKDQAPKLGLTKEICFHYLSKSIRYDLGINEIEGMKKFGEYLQDYDIDIKSTKQELLFENLNTLQINS
ncbi:MAG: hypothetical protein GWN11_08525 [Candidatus Dadabacteria bacterium]|nr:hypothetical protein [Candidatus Dadabacteria bacterium]NIX15912.1 hypothetical protein [Candidatus Dadabacteria bacterium]